LEAEGEQIKEWVDFNGRPEPELSNLDISGRSPAFGLRCFGESRQNPVRTSKDAVLLKLHFIQKGLEWTVDLQALTPFFNGHRPAWP